MLQNLTAMLSVYTAQEISCSLFFHVSLQRPNIFWLLCDSTCLQNTQLSFYLLKELLGLCCLHTFTLWIAKKVIFRSY